MSNSQVHVDPERLKSFAAELDQFANRVTDYDEGLQSALHRLGETFRDQEYEEFKTHFGASSQLLRRFVEEVKKNVPKLVADAEIIAMSQKVKPNI